MRHIEDEKRLANDKDNSRLGHEMVAATSETALTHVDSTDKTAGRAMQHGDTTKSETPIPPTSESIKPVADPANLYDPDSGMNRGKTLSSKALHILDQIMPDDRANETAQAIKHDVLETPAAILDAMNDVSEMRERGRRLFFENKEDKPLSSESTDSPTVTDSGLLIEESTTSRLTSETSGTTGDGDYTTLEVNDDSTSDSRINRMISGNKDYYATLGVSVDADETTLKNAYREMGKKYHPDANNGDKAATEKFKEANEAYSVLGDPQRRQIYDQKRAQVLKPSDKTDSKKDSAVNIAEGKLKHKPADKVGKTSAGGKKNDRFARRMLDRSYILSQGASKLMPDEQQDEDSGTKGIRSMISESAKLVKIFATAERKPSKMRHVEDEEKLTHENTSEESRLEHEAIEGEDVLRLEHSDGETPNLLQHGGIPLLSDGSGDIDVEADTEKPDKPLIDEDISTDAEVPETETTALVPVEVGGDSGVVDTDIRITTSIPTSKSQADIKIENQIDKNIDKYTAEAAKLEKKIEKAGKKIPKKKVKKSKLTHDESGKPKRQISFADEKVAQADAKWNQGQSKTLSANSGRYVTGHASVFIHGKVSESENLTGNTGLKAAHTGEKAVVKTYQTAKRVNRYVKNAPYRKLQHLKLKETQNKGKLAYQQLLKDKPELRKNTVSRLIQKRRINREYAKAFRAAQAGGKVGTLGKAGAVIGVGAAAVSGDGKALAKMGFKTGLRIAFKKVGAALAKAAAPILLKIGAILLIIGAILLLFTMCASLIGTGTGYLIDAISYQADMDDITEYSVYMTQLEVELKEEIIEAATDLDGLHEFRLVVNSPSGGTDVIFEGTLVAPGLGHPYFVLPVYAPPDFNPTVLLPFLSDITHNPFEVMAYLTAVYGNFEGYDINAILREIFDTAFTLEIVEGFEVRTAIVEAWYYEWQDWGWTDSEGNWVSNWVEVRIPPFSEPMNYNWYYREVRLTVNMTIAQVIQNRMNADQQEHYDVLMESLGLRQFVGSPFADNWLPHMTSPFGYRFHPITLTREMHTGIDIARPEGTPILSGAPGTVIFAGDMGGYGNTVIIEYFDEESGIGVRLLYAHMHEINVAVGDELAIGDVIGTVGSTGVSTGNHLHMEVSINEDGGAWRRINPLFFVEPFTS